MIYKRLALGFLFLLFFNASFSQLQKTWKVSAPEEQGMNSLILANAIKNFKQDGINIHSLLIIKNDHVVLDVCFYPFQKNYVHDLASVTKSITSLLIGIAIDKKFIKNENEPVFQYFPEYTITNDTLKKITIKDLLNMSSGLRCSWDDGEKELNQMTNSADWVKFMFSLPFDTMPGQKFSYCSGNFYLLAEILQRTTKMTCHVFAKKYLFDPLNFKESYWLENYKSVNQGWGDLHMHPYDLAKIGCLLLNNGKWNDKQIISNEWLEKIKPLYYIHGTESYGYGWWLDSENPDEIQALGRGGQRLFILREKKIVMVATGGGFDAGDIDNYALQSIKSFNKNKNYNDQLLDQVKVAGSEDMTSPAIIEDKFSINELNKTFQFNKNDLKLKTIRFEQRNKDDYIILDFDNGTKEEHLIGMNDQYKISKEPTFGLPMAVKGRWINDNTLEINYNRLCRIEDFKFRITFKGNSIELTITESTKKINETFIGKAL
jgi:CubicO group peptidase (beta-lactamase class C family)